MLATVLKPNGSLAPSLASPLLLLPLRKRNITTGTQRDIASMSKTNTKTEQLPLDLNDLITAVRALPEEYRVQLEQPMNRVVEYTRRRRRILNLICLLYTSPSPRDATLSRMPSSA